MKIIDPTSPPPRRWNNQFTADYTVPDEILSLCRTHPVITDLSWGNDVCPSFGWFHDRSETTVQLWVDHPDPDKRENGPDTARFTLTVEVPNHHARQMLVPGEFEPGVIWHSDTDAVEAAAELTAAVNVAHRILTSDPADLW